jgi:hypothetical protein
LCVQRSLASLVLCDLVHCVLHALLTFAERTFLLWHVHLRSLLVDVLRSSKGSLSAVTHDGQRTMSRTCPAKHSNGSDAVALRIAHLQKRKRNKHLTHSVLWARCFGYLLQSQGEHSAAARSPHPPLGCVLSRTRKPPTHENAEDPTKIRELHT